MVFEAAVVLLGCRVGKIRSFISVNDDFFLVPQNFMAVSKAALKEMHDWLKADANALNEDQIEAPKHELRDILIS